MILGRVIGNIVSTMKLECYRDKKVLLVQPVNPDRSSKSGTMVAVDLVGAGEGDYVLVASEGRAAMELLGSPNRIPLRSVIVGIVDRIDRA